MKRYKLLVLGLLVSVTLASSVRQDKTLGEHRSRQVTCPTNGTEEKYQIAPRIILHYGYPVECHTVTTLDGYILGLHRIPHGRNITADRHKKPVLLMHGIFGSSANWLTAGPKIGLGFLLADQGYDVWLGNVRGNTYSRRHVNLSTDEYKFWNFSFHENGIYDIPAKIDYILQYTGHAQLNYIGHSMGNTMFYIMSSLRPEYNQKIAGQISLAPVGYFKHTTSPLFGGLAPFGEIIKTIVDSFFHGELVSRGPLLDGILHKVCMETVLGQNLCRSILFFIFGWDPAQIPTNLIPDIVADVPAGIAIKAFVHFTQLVKSGRFCQFDYGQAQNQLYYHSALPPDYNISAISSKIIIVYGKNDPLTSELDLLKFYSQLPNPGGLFTLPYPAFTHLDFLWGKDLNTLLAPDVGHILASFDSKRNTPSVNRLIPVDLVGLRHNVGDVESPVRKMTNDILDALPDVGRKNEIVPSNVKSYLNNIFKF